VLSFTLPRLESAPNATYGRIEDATGHVVCVTLEPPDCGNKSGVSCIPAGTYIAIRYKSPKRGYDVWLLQHVDGRTMIEMHIGNTPADTDGCILLGTAFGWVKGVHGITESEKAFDAFMALTAAEDTIQITVVAPAAAA
jgi:uncharacterized protein DUF5675